MRRLAILTGVAVAIAVALAATVYLEAADSPFAGNWKINFFQEGQEITLWIVKVREKNGKPEVEVLSALPKFKDVRMENVRVTDAGGLAFTAHSLLTFPFVFYPPAGEARPTKLLGSLENDGVRFFARLERTDDKELNPEKAVVQSPDFDQGRRALETENAKDRQAALKEFVNKTTDPFLNTMVGFEVLRLMAKNGSPAGEMRTQAEQLVKHSATYGPEMKAQTLVLVVKQLLASDKTASVALDLARQGEKALAGSLAPAQEAALLKILTAAERKADKNPDTTALAARIAKLDALLDEEFAQTAIPFKPEAFAGRKGKSERVVLLELFTGAECPPCVAADIAFDALLQTYKPSQVVLLEYHEHIPAPDPLTNPASESRYKYYKPRGTPSLYIDGGAGPEVLGPKAVAKKGYQTILQSLGDELETAAQAKLKLTGNVQGDQITIQAEVSDLKKKGDQVRLRLVLVEEVVRYPGGNGQRLHHHVVRAMPGGAEGLPLTKDGVKHDAKISLAELTKSLDKYLSDFAKKYEVNLEERPLQLKNLKVVAFVQDDDSKEVLQAAQVDLTESK